MSSRKTHRMLGSVLFMTLIAAWFAPSEKEDGVALAARAQNVSGRVEEVTRAATNRTANSATRTANSSSVEVLLIRSRESETEGDDQDARFFASTQWTTPSKKASVVNAVPTDVAHTSLQAPVLPFRVLGRYEEAGQETIFLQSNDQNLVVRVGDIIIDQYKVESLNGTTLTLRYLPLNQLQRLEIAGVQ